MWLIDWSFDGCTFVCFLVFTFTITWYIIGNEWDICFLTERVCRRFRAWGSSVIDKILLINTDVLTQEQRHNCYQQIIWNVLRPGNTFPRTSAPIDTSDLFLIYKIEASVQMSMATRRLNPKFLFSRFCVPRPIASLLLRFPDNTDPRKTRRNKHVSCSFTLWSEDANYKYKHHANTLNPT